MPVPGSLVLVATPIGNLGDLSPRAARALAEADVVACEDTRRTRQLLTHAGITGKRLMAVHDHNEPGQVRPVLDLLERGATVAVVSDAGTPALSDPGGRLAAAASAAGATVSAVPGPSALVGALVVSGLPAGRFCFEGFLPRRGRERVERLAAIAGERRTTVLYEAPHRLAATLEDLAGACGRARQVVVVRELTKLHEEVWRGNLGDAAARALATAPRGEHTVVLAGAPEPPRPGRAEVEAAAAPLVAAGHPARQVAAEVAAGLGVPRREAYDAVLALRAGGPPGGRATR